MTKALNHSSHGCGCGVRRRGPAHWTGEGAISDPSCGLYRRGTWRGTPVPRCSEPGGRRGTPVDLREIGSELTSEPTLQISNVMGLRPTPSAQFSAKQDAGRFGAHDRWGWTDTRCWYWAQRPTTTRAALSSGLQSNASRSSRRRNLRRPPRNSARDPSVAAILDGADDFTGLLLSRPIHDRIRSIAVNSRNKPPVQ